MKRKRKAKYMMTLPRKTVTGALQKRRHRRSKKRHQTEPQLGAAGPPGAAALENREVKKKRLVKVACL